MADDKLPTPTMVLNASQWQAQQLAKEVEERAKDPLDVAKRPGGFFLRADGTPVDCNNIEIPADKLTAEEKKAVRAAGKQVEEQDTERAQADKDAAKAQAEADKQAAAARKAAEDAEAQRVEAARAQATASAKRGGR